MVDFTKPAGMNRRTLLAGAGAVALSAPFAGRAFAQEETIRIGFIGALSGIRSSFGASTAHTIGEIEKAFASHRPGKGWRPWGRPFGSQRLAALGLLWFDGQRLHL